MRKQRTMRPHWPILHNMTCFSDPDPFRATRIGEPTPFNSDLYSSQFRSFWWQVCPVSGEASEALLGSGESQCSLSLARQQVETPYACGDTPFDMVPAPLEWLLSSYNPSWGVHPNQNGHARRMDFVRGCMGHALCPTPTNQIQRRMKKNKKKGQVQLPAGMMRVDFMGAGASD